MTRKVPTKSSQIVSGGKSRSKSKSKLMFKGLFFCTGAVCLVSCGLVH